MKEIWLIIAIWSGGDGNDWFHFPSPIFENHSICTRYVLENYWDLNSNVNEAYLKKPFKTKNFFFCIEENEWNYIRKKYPNPWETY